MRFLSRLSACVLVSSLAACGAGADGKGDNSHLGNDGGLDLDSTTFDTLDPGFEVDPGEVDPSDGACASKTVGGKPVPLTIAIVFDQSGSMKDGDKIGTAKAGLKKAFGDPKFDDVAVGLFRFGYDKPCPSCPFGFPDSCGYDNTPTFTPELLSTGRTKLFSAIDALSAVGSTPTFDALNASYAWLAPQILAKKIEGKVAVVLVTDGAPNCSGHTADEFVALIKKGRSATIDTFIIGLPGSGAVYDGDPAKPHTTAMLSKMAGAGTDPPNLPAGCATDPKPMTSPVTNPCYFNFDSAVTVDMLSTALDGIRKVAGSCEYSMPTPSPAYDMEHPIVLVTDSTGKSSEVPRCTDTTKPPPEGCWEFADTAHTRIKLYGDACTRAKSSDKSKVDILLKCKVK